jgi:hypothetical protein
MTRLRLILGAFAFLAAPALAEGGVTLVNGTGEPLGNLAMRSYNREPWSPLGTGAAAVGQRQRLATREGECAFDVRATLPNGKQVTWAGVNLCDTITVTLNRRVDGASWVDYD